jgi:hypothetical protein
MSRQAISKKTRFEVFKRDAFQCVYCGNHPTELIVLHVDHVHPVAEGGSNDIENLVTACSDCNLGKGARLLTAVPQSLEEKAEETAERESQIRAYYEIMEERRLRRDEELWSIADIFMERYRDDSILRARLASIRTFLDRLDYFEVREAMELATNRMYSQGPAFKYFCGICWRKIKRANGEEA